MRVKFSFFLGLIMVLVAFAAVRLVEVNAVRADAVATATPASRIHIPFVLFLADRRGHPPTAETSSPTPLPTADALRWEVQEITFTSNDDHPWDQFPLQATFVHEESNQKLTVDGYWRGGKEWSVRFALPLAGRWHWQTLSPDAGLSGKRGQLDIGEATEAQVNANPNYRGHLQVSKSGRHLAYADNTPFLWLGDTNWNLNSLRAGLEVGSHGSPFYRYLADRKAKKFTLIQTQFFEIIDANEGGYPFPNNINDSGDWSLLNPAHFAKLDTRVQAIWDAGFAIAAHPTWLVHVPASKTTVADAKVISRYLLARYGAYNLLWSLSGEYQYGYDNGKYTWETADWKSLGRFVQSHNAYRHPVTIHPSSQTAWKKFAIGAGEQSSSGEFHTQNWLDINIQQTGHQEKTLKNIPKRLLQDYQKIPIRPSIHAEGWYENHDRYGDPPTAAQLRWKLWATFLSGGAGYTYGAVGVWPFYNPDVDKKPPLRWNETTWHEGILAPGSEDIGRVSDILSKLAWWALEPARTRVTVAGRKAQYDYEEGQQDPHLAALPKDALLLLYIPEGDQGQAIRIDDFAADAEYAAQWLNPRDGSAINIEMLSTDPDGTIHVPDRLSDDDWLLLLTANNWHD